MSVRWLAALTMGVLGAIVLSTLMLLFNYERWWTWVLGFAAGFFGSFIRKD